MPNFNNVINSFNQLIGSNHSYTYSLPKSIVIVDDEPDICVMLKIALQENRYSVDTFTDSTEALEQLLNNHNKYHLLISDYHMPNLNGCEFVAKVKEINGNIKVILMSAYDSIGDKNKLNFELLRKPFTLEKLLDTINISLNNNDLMHY